MTGFGDDADAQFGRQVVQAGRRRHPAGSAVAAGPRAAQAPAGDLLVEPRVAVRRRHPLGLAPREQRVDERMHGAVRLQPPRPRVGHVDPDARQQRTDVGRVAQIDADAGTGRGGGEHLVVAGTPAGRGLGLRARPRPDERADHRLHRRYIYRQTVGRQFRAQQLGGRLGTGGRPGVAPHPERAKVRLLFAGHVARRSGPASETLGGIRPRAACPLGPKVPVGSDRIVGIVAFVGRGAEKIELTHHGQRVGR